MENKDMIEGRLICLETIIENMATKKYFPIALAILFLSLTNLSADPIKDYCNRYVLSLSQQILKIENPQITTEIVEHPFYMKILNSIGNLFSPSDSKIDYGLLCKFKTNNCEGEITILLIENKAFAHYTKWEGTQIIEIGEAIVNNKKYYLVLKYLEMKENKKE